MPRNTGSEAANKAAAKLRDGGKCQRPHCPHCARQPFLSVDGAHWKAKGMGGDPQLLRSQRKHFITLDRFSHREQEQHELVILPHDPELLMDGERSFFKVIGGVRVYEGTSRPLGRLHT